MGLIATVAVRIRQAISFVGKLNRFEINTVLDAKLTAREIYQVLRDVSFGLRSMRRITEHTWNEIYCGLMTVEADGWMITFFIDYGELDYCDNCCSPDDRKYEFTSDINALDPVALLSPEEHRKLEELLTNI